MSEANLIKVAFDDYAKDKSETYIISNLLFDLTKKESFKEVIHKLNPIPEEFYDDTDVLISLYRKAIKSGLDVKISDLNELQNWIEAGLPEKIPYGKSTVCLLVAAFFSPYGNEFNEDPSLTEKYSNMELVRKWVGLALDYAENLDEYIHIIEHIGLEYQGLHLADKNWAAEVSELIIPKLSVSDVKKFKKKIKDIL